MTECKHETCPYCHRIVEPIVRLGKHFRTLYCPNCQKVISDVLRGNSDDV